MRIFSRNYFLKITAIYVNLSIILVQSASPPNPNERLPVKPRSDRGIYCAPQTVYKKEQAENKKESNSKPFIFCIHRSFFLAPNRILS